MTDHLRGLDLQRDDFIENPGTDPDYDGILDEIGGEDRDDAEGDINARWFDHVLNLFRTMSASGSLTVHRRISVADIDAFLASIDTRPLGSSWSWDEESASCEYHPEANHDHEVLLTARAPCTSIHWEDSMVQHFGHPHEREVVVEGPVTELTVIVEGRRIARLETATA